MSLGVSLEIANCIYWDMKFQITRETSFGDDVEAYIQNRTDSIRNFIKLRSDLHVYDLRLEWSICFFLFYFYKPTNHFM